MIYLQDENDYDTDEEMHRTVAFDRINDNQYSYKIEIVSFYKDLLLYEPEFIGIKNISSGLLLRFVETTRKTLRLNKNDYRLNTEQYNIFNNMYNDLQIKGNYNLYNTITKKIFNKIYV